MFSLYYATFHLNRRPKIYPEGQLWYRIRIINRLACGYSTIANRMRMFSVADSCEPVAERPYGEWLTISISQRLDYTRPYLHRCKNRRGTFYSVSSVKKITLSYYAVYALLESRWLDSPSTTRAIRFHSGASFAVDFIRHCETRCNAAGCPFSLSLFPFSLLSLSFLSLSFLSFCFFYSVHRLDRLCKRAN